MKEIFKSVLKSSDLYHPLQSLYRRSINTAVKLYYRTSYRSLRGKGFTCNFCGHQYERFVPEYPNKKAAPVLAQANGFTVRLLTATYLQQYATYAIQENECVIAGYKA